MVDDVDGPRAARIQLFEPTTIAPDRARAIVTIAQPSDPLAQSMGLQQGYGYGTSVVLDGFVRAAGDLVTFESSLAPLRMSWTFVDGSLVRRGDATAPPYFASQFGANTSLTLLLLDGRRNVIASRTWRSDD